MLNEILDDNYVDKVDKDELMDYFNVVKNYSLRKEIERLTSLIKKEYDPVEQAKIADRITKLRMGE